MGNDQFGKEGNGEICGRGGVGFFFRSYKLLERFELLDRLERI
jgi:hypothetical protein